MRRGRRSLSRVALALAALTTSVVVAGCGSVSANRRVVKWYVFNEPSGAYKQAAANCSKGKPYTVQLVPLPTDADQQRELVVRRLAAKDPDIDIIGMDVIWTGEFAQAGWIRPVPSSIVPQAKAGVLPGPLATATYLNRLWTIPFTSNTQLLWYNKKVVKTAPPTTWAQMIQQAVKLKSKVEIQGKKYEGLTVWFNSLIQSAGGQILTAQGQPALGAPAKTAATVMKDLATSAAADPSLSNQKEDDNRLAFEKGGVAFEINYPFIYASAAMVPGLQKNIGFARWPRVVANLPSRPPIGGINLGVSAYSKNPSRAFQAALCLAQPANQIIASQKGGLPPTQASLYDTPQIKKAFPFAALLKTSIGDGAPRPVTPAYSDVSLAVQATLSPPKGVDPNTIDSDLKSKLDKAKKGEIF